MSLKICFSRVCADKDYAIKRCRPSAAAIKRRFGEPALLDLQSSAQHSSAQHQVSAELPVSRSLVNKPDSLVLYPGIMNYCKSAPAPDIKARCAAAALTSAHELSRRVIRKLCVKSLPVLPILSSSFNCACIDARGQ